MTMTNEWWNGWIYILNNVESNADGMDSFPLFSMLISLAACINIFIIILYLLVVSVTFYENK